MDVKGSKNVADGATTLTKVARASQGSVQFLDDSEWKQISLSLRLSPREAEIVRLLLSARSEKNVAEALAISVHTVHSHLERLYRKLSIRSRSELLVSIFLAYVQRQR
jgi:DNA-binding CsgD family transcriptional regulator